MDTTIAANRVHWRYAGMAFLIAFVGVILLLFPTSESFVRTWMGGETYNHGFVILPISLWLVWQKRADLKNVVPQPVLLPLLGVAFASMVWMLGRLAGVQIVEQFSFVVILIGISMAILGWRLSFFLAFPLVFLIFAVPMGEELIPPMMEFTASFTVEALRLTGIPVYREGLWFVLPSGNWSVVEACSGVRYIISSVTLGFLYAYISYHTLWKRIAFIAVSAVVPIIANGLRAYLIVIVGHLSNMELATGVDHLIYGWVFFGLIMLLLFWIGGYWAEKHPPLVIEGEQSLADSVKPSRQLLVAGAGLAIVAAANLLFLYMSSPNDLASRSLSVPQTINGWNQLKGKGKLRPTHNPTRYRLHTAFGGTGSPVSVFLGYYPNQSQGYEAVAMENAIVGNKRGSQQLKPLPPRRLPMAVGGSEVDQHILVLSKGAFETERLLVWNWYRIAGVEHSNRILSKLYEIRSRLLQSRSDGAWIAIGTPLQGENIEAAQRHLDTFVKEVYPTLARSMDNVLKVAE